MKNEYVSLDDFAAWELEAYADGEALPHVAEFFEKQPAAWQKWRRDQQWGSAFKAKLHRFDCPMPEQLLAYQRHELAAPAHQQLEAHLRLCTSCALEVQHLRAFLHEESTPLLPVQSVSTQITQTAQPPTLWGQLQALADQVQLVVATLVPSTTPHFAGVALRSDGPPTLQRSRQTTLLFDAGEAAISLLLQEESTGALRLVGQLLTPLPIGAGLSKLSAAHATDVVIQAPINDTGNFVIEPLQPDFYQLVLMLPDQAIVVPNLQLTLQQ